MIQRIGRKKYNIYAMDVESHNDEESIAKKETSIWLGCFINEESKINEEGSYFYSISDFLDRLEDLSSPKRNKSKTRLCKNVCVYIYNLSFEWSFILPVLESRGILWNRTIDKDSESGFNSITTKSCSSVWEVTLKLKKSNGIVKLRDLAKIFGGGLGKVAKSFNLPTQKGEIDYRKNRLHNYVVTEEEKEYCFKDTRIIIDILLKMQNDKDFWKSLSASSYSMLKLLKYGYPRATKPYMEYRKGYPILNEVETAFLREGVEGGITYAPERWQFKTIKSPILHIDMHQAHPTSAYCNMFPYGEGEYFIGRPPKGRISACRIRISYDSVRLHSIIKLIGLPMVADKEIVVWNFEIPTMKKCYVNLDIEYIEGYAYKFKPLPWRQYYAHNYRERLKAKKEGNQFLINYFKLLNNSSYGKLLEKPHNFDIHNYIREDGIIDSVLEEKEEDEIKVQAKYTYLPVGSCIPAYTRVRLVETALLFGYENVVYFDTDSIFVLLTEKNKHVWDTINQEDFLNGWGLEEIIDEAQFTAPKRYKTRVGNNITLKMGGINPDKFLEENGYDSINEVDFEELNITDSTWKVQRAFRVKGGTIIDFQVKEMTLGKYQDIYEHNVLSARL